jgi:DNA repair protein SbcD/Mre11
MRLLHTSDWHLGRSFHGASLLDEQEAMVGRVVDVASESAADLVVIAGDLFDRAIPPAEAVDLFAEALVRLRATGARVVAISGNHDSAIRVGANDRLLTPAGVTIRGDVRRLDEPVVFDDGDGRTVAVYPVPFLDPVVAGPLLDTLPIVEGPITEGEVEPGEPVSNRRPRLTHHQVATLAAQRIRADLARHKGALSVVVAHAFVAGGAMCESERQLSVGNVDRVALDVFRGFDYVALGHLHTAQQWEGGRIAYSGSPLPYSFSEEGRGKSVRVVEVSPAGLSRVEEVALGVGRALCTIEGELEELLADPRWAPAEEARVRARLTDPHLPVQAMARLRRRFPHAVEMRHLPPGGGPIGERPAPGASSTVVPPIDLAGRFWADQTGSELTEPELALLVEAFDIGAVGAR